MDDDEKLTISEAVDYLDGEFSAQTIRSWCDEGVKDKFRRQFLKHENKRGLILIDEIDLIAFYTEAPIQGSNI